MARVSTSADLGFDEAGLQELMGGRDYEVERTTHCTERTISSVNWKATFSWDPENGEYSVTLISLQRRDHPEYVMYKEPDLEIQCPDLYRLSQMRELTPSPDTATYMEMLLSKRLRAVSKHPKRMQRVPGAIRVTYEHEGDSMVVELGSQCLVMASVTAEQFPDRFVPVPPDADNYMRSRTIRLCDAAMMLKDVELQL